MSQSGSPRVSWLPRGADCSIVRWCATSSYMRKWMTERLKRRKKPGEGSTKEATNAPEPLQPRFYDNEPAAPTAAPVAAPVVESRRPSRAEPEPARAPEPEPVSAAAASSPASVAGEPRPRTSRRRRSRGGRGGGGSRPGAIASAPAVAAEPSAGEAPAVEGAVSKPVVAGKAPGQAAPAPARPSKGTVVLAIGLPGSGKG